MSAYPEDTPSHAFCLMEGHYWRGGACSRCGERLRCGACGRFVTEESLSQHIDEACPVNWVEYEGLLAEGAA